MTRLVGATDWSRTPLGPMDRWPRSLRALVDVLLAQPVAMIVLWGPDLTQIYNDAYAAVAGAKHPAALGIPTRQCWPEVWHINGPIYDRVLGRGETVLLEDALFPLARNNGQVEETYLNVSYGPARDDDGRIAGVFITVVKHARRVRAEADRDRLTADLLGERLRLADVAERAPAFICTLRGPDHVFELANPPYYDLIGRREIIGKPVREVFDESEAGAFFKLLDDVYRTGEPFFGRDLPIDLRRPGPGGDVATERRFLNFVYHPIRDAGGAVTGIFVHGVDVTDLVRGREALRASEARFRALVTASSDVVYRMSPDWFEMRHLRGQEFIADTDDPTVSWMDKYIHPDDRPRVTAAIREAVRTKGVFELEHRVRRVDGTLGWTLSRAVPLLDERGEIAEWFGAATDVTARHEAEGALRERADRFERQSRLFEQIASTTPDFIYVFDLDGRFRYANRRLLDVWGRTYEEAVGRSLYELGYPQWHADMHMREIRQVIETRRPVKGEVPFTGGSGISGVYEYIFTPILGADGAVEAIAGTTRDVTDRGRVERELAEAKAAAESGLARWRAVVENMAEGVVLADAEGHMVEWNRAALAMHGYASADDVRANLNGIAPSFQVTDADGNLIPVEQWPIPRLTRGEAFKNWEARVRRTDVPLDRTISYSGTPIRDRDGNVTLVLLTLHDVTDERRAQRALAEGEAHFRDTFEQSPIGMSVTDFDNHYLHVNPAYCRLVGYTREELLDPSFDFRTLVHPDDQPKMLELQRQVRAGLIPSFFLEKRYIRKDGSTVWVRVTGTARQDAAGRPTQFIRLVEDIDDSKRAEDERAALLDGERAARSEAERASRMKDEFLSTLSHELRTPLNAIVGWSQILRNPAAGPDDIAEGVATIERNARAQAQIIDDLLDMSRVVSGKLRLDVQRVDLAEVVRAGVETVRPAADAKGVRLQAVIDPLAGPVSGDPNRLHQVLWNLLTNAVKFTPKGGRVQVLLERVNSHVEVSVIDTGEGIAPEFLPHVFDRFRQADSSTTRRHGGLGLGLAIVKQLVEMHGGGVRVKSAGKGYGSTFTVALPLTVVHPAAEPEPERRHPRGPAPVEAYDAACAQLKGVRVLVVDDEPDARALVQRLLEGCEAEVRAAASAVEAFEALAAYRPDVLVSDIGMPGEDGYSLIRRVRALGAERGGSVPALALTAYARSEDRIRAISAGFQMHVVKPVEPAELITMVASLAGRMSGREE